LGNLDARRDWGWAPDYVEAMVLAARADNARDYVVATGVAHSVRDFVQAAFQHVGIAEWEHLVVVDPEFVRPADPTELVGDPSRARSALGWSPTVGFHQLVGRMVDADGVVDMKEDEYLRRLAGLLGMEYQEYSDLVLDYEIDELRDSFEQLRSPPPPMVQAGEKSKPPPPPMVDEASVRFVLPPGAFGDDDN
ncbi:MAG: GDP-mannose 4,6-dehydratase, partial [Myxococcales bacterium]|nr:GDP-mannose 4,6-dehydratase [Myxococcales bacterium]